MSKRTLLKYEILIDTVNGDFVTEISRPRIESEKNISEALGRLGYSEEVWGQVVSIFQEAADILDRKLEQV